MAQALHKTARAADIIEQLERELEASTPATLSLYYRLKLREIAMRLVSTADKSPAAERSLDMQATLDVLTDFRSNLSRRRKNNDELTADRLSALPEPSRSIVFSQIAYTFRDAIDDFTQIDFSNKEHVEFLKLALDHCVLHLGKEAGRPINKPLDRFFHDLTDLYTAVTGTQAVAGAHYNNQPKTHFERLMYLGYQLIRPAQEYPSALKAYERALSRKS